MQSTMTLELTGDPSSPMKISGNLKGMELREFIHLVFRYSPEWAETARLALEDAEQCQN